MCPLLIMVLFILYLYFWGQVDMQSGELLEMPQAESLSSRGINKPSRASFLSFGYGGITNHLFSSIWVWVSGPGLAVINVRVYMTTKVLMSRTSNELATLASKWRTIKKQMTGIRKTKKMQSLKKASVPPLLWWRNMHSRNMPIKREIPEGTPKGTLL